MKTIIRLLIILLITTYTIPSAMASASEATISDSDTTKYVCISQFENYSIYPNAASNKKSKEIATVIESGLINPILLINTTLTALSSSSENQYTDVDSGVTFSVPANWKQKAFTKDREFIDVKFVSTKENGCVIIYGSTDVWGLMSASDRAGYTRSGINNSAFTKSDIAAMYNTTVDQISSVRYNGIQYFKGETNYTSNVYGVDITVRMTQLVYFDNGWMYTFRFGGTTTHKLYSDFENLLKSVHYPTTSKVSSTANNANDNANNSPALIAVIVLLSSVAAIIVAVIVYHKKRRNEPTDHTPMYTIHCRKCGQALPLDSDFCHKCGTKVFKEDNV
ncbi:MAG: zinc ribbon domain-containing protein [Clostridia bacterium]|nr:zinc ribbon domain-containing protein [Clostridia bacterium]